MPIANPGRERSIYYGRRAFSGCKWSHTTNAMITVTGTLLHNLCPFYIMYCRCINQTVSLHLLVVFHQHQGNSPFPTEAITAFWNQFHLLRCSKTHPPRIQSSPFCSLCLKHNLQCQGGHTKVFAGNMFKFTHRVKKESIKKYYKCWWCWELKKKGQTKPWMKFWDHKKGTRCPTGLSFSVLRRERMILGWVCNRFVCSSLLGLVCLLLFFLRYLWEFLVWKPNTWNSHLLWTDITSHKRINPSYLMWTKYPASCFSNRNPLLAHVHSRSKVSNRP